MTTPHLTDLRAHLMDTLAALRDRETPMDVDRARAVATVASVLVDTAKVEVDYLRVTGQDAAPFLEAPADVPKITSDGTAPPILTGLVPGVTVHRLRG